MSIAAELITRGWHQGGYEGADGSVCIEGAVACAHGKLPHEYDRSISHALDAVREAIAFERTRSVVAWNDDPERTFDEVLRVAKEADEILDAS